MASQLVGAAPAYGQMVSVIAVRVLAARLAFGLPLQALELLE